MEIRKVGVVGTGAMGAGIIYQCAIKGFTMVGNDIDQKFLDAGMKTIDRYAKIAVRREKTLSADQADAAKARISMSTDIASLAECDLVIEAIVEKMDIKKQLFEKLNSIVSPETLLASNTSSLSIEEMAQASGRPERFIGLHFFNPVPYMKLVEVIKTSTISDETLETGIGFVKAIEKDPIVVSDTPGFVVNYILMNLLLGAVNLYEKGVASIEDIDAGMKLGANHPEGPLKLLDIIGIDVAVHVSESIWKMTGEENLKPPKTLVNMMEQGKLGKKTGEGFYKYN